MYLWDARKEPTNEEIEMLKRLCGEGAFGNILLVGTMWDLIPARKMAEAEARESRVKDNQFKDLIAHGARIVRHDNSIVSSHKIMQTRQTRPSPTLDIQRELVDVGQSLENTKAGMLVARPKMARREYVQVEKIKVSQQIEDAKKAQKWVQANELKIDYDLLVNDEEYLADELNVLTQPRDMYLRALDAALSSLNQDEASDKVFEVLRPYLTLPPWLGEQPTPFGKLAVAPFFLGILSAVLFMLLTALFANGWSALRNSDMLTLPSQHFPDASCAIPQCSQGVPQIIPGIDMPGVQEVQMPEAVPRGENPADIPTDQETIEQVVDDDGSRPDGPKTEGGEGATVDLGLILFVTCTTAILGLLARSLQ